MSLGITLAQASAIVDGTLAEGRRLGLAPLTVTVLDAGGHQVATKREDGSSLLRPQIAMAKAWGVLAIGSGGRAIEQRAQAAPALINTLMTLAEGRLVPAAGGVIIRDESGAILGSVGVSGDMPPRDEACALVGVAGAGLLAEA